MVCGGAAAALLAIQIANRSHEEPQEETHYRPYEMPHNSLTGTVSTCLTAQPFISMTGKYER